MKNWLDIDNIKEGDIVIKNKSKVQVIHIEILDNYAMFKWKYLDKDNVIHTNEFVRCDQRNGGEKWEDLTEKIWE